MKILKQFLADEFPKPVTWRETAYGISFIITVRIFTIAGDAMWNAAHKEQWVAAIVHGTIAILFWECIVLGIRFAKWHARKRLLDEQMGC